MDTSLDAFDWTVRNAVYETIREQTAPPTVAEISAMLGVNSDDVRASYERLHDRHALFLTPGSHDVRMAHPFSGVPTTFRVEVLNRAYWANCAWDALGIPAAMHADARIDARAGDDPQPIELAVKTGHVQGWDGIVHFPLPFRRWYDDLIET